MRVSGDQVPLHVKAAVADSLQSWKIPVVQMLSDAYNDGRFLEKSRSGTLTGQHLRGYRPFISAPLLRRLSEAVTA